MEIRTENKQNMSNGDHVPAGIQVEVISTSSAKTKPFMVFKNFYQLRCTVLNFSIPAKHMWHVTNRHPWHSVLAPTEQLQGFHLFNIFRFSQEGKTFWTALLVRKTFPMIVKLETRDNLPHSQSICPMPAINEALALQSWCVVGTIYS